MVLPRRLVAPASRHKAPQSGLWLLLRNPVGTLKNRGLWSRGQHRPQKTRRHSQRFFVGVCLVTCFVETKSSATFRQNTVTSRSSEHRAEERACHPGGAAPRCHSAPYATQKEVVQSPSHAPGVAVSRLRTSPGPAGLHAPRLTHHWRAGSCSADMPGGVREPDKTPQGPHSRS